MLSVPVSAAALSTSRQSSRTASGTPVVVNGSNMVPPRADAPCVLNSANSRAASGWAAISCIG
jgi:hypothetical protein